MFHYRENDGNYGSGRITKAIRRNGIKVNKKRIARLMRINKIRAKTKKKFKITTKQDLTVQASPNLLNQEFSSEKINKIWTSDITYIWSKEGWLYLAVVMGRVLNCYSRYLIAWKLFTTMKETVVTDLLYMATETTDISSVSVRHKPRLLSDNGPCYLVEELKEYLTDKEIKHPEQLHITK
jgi:transposase InsO family protein